MIAYLQSQDQVLTVRKRSAAKNIRASLCIARNAQSYRLSAFSTLIFLFFLASSNAQSVEVSAGFNRLDYQVGAGYSQRWGALFLTSKMEVAVTSTFAQKRFAPRLSVGTSYLNTAITDDTLDVSMGRDKGVVVQRDRIKDFCKTTGFGANKKTIRGYKLIVKNNF